MRQVVLFVSCTFFAVCVTRFLWAHQYFPFEGPEAYCESVVFDFGSAKSGDVVKHLFRLENRGKRDLDIRRIRTDCGCATAELSRNIVPPGESVDVAVELSLLGLAGDVQKRMVIDTNDIHRPYTILVMRGTVEADIQVEPGELLIDLSDGEEYAVEVFCEQNADFEVTKVSAGTPALEVRFEVVEEGKRFRVHAKANDSDGSVAERATHIAVRTNHPLESLLVVPVRLRERQPVGR